MARLSAHDERRVAEVIAALGEIEEGSPNALERTLPMVRNLLEASVAGAYGVRAGHGGTSVDLDHWLDFKRSREEARITLSGYFRRLSRGRGLFNALRPERRQRNRAAIFPLQTWARGEEPEEIARQLESEAPRFGFPDVTNASHTVLELKKGCEALGVPAESNLRILICDGSSLLNLVGALRQEPFQERHRIMLQRLAAPLRERLIVERRIGGAGLEHAAMVAALEHIPAAAFLLDAQARVVHANAVGRHRLETQKRATHAALAKAIERRQDRPPEAVTTVLSGPGMPRLYLVISGARGDRLRFALETARSRWQLTPRETEVLAELAAGRSNRDAAEKLDVSERTLELHISSILRKAYADTRSQLIIDLWHLADAP